MDKRFNIEDQLSFAEKSDKCGLRGHVTVSLENKETGETKLWYEDDNTISISGMQWILMKMFGLHLDSVHDPSKSYEDLGQDTTLVIPDLNDSETLGIGVSPDSYTVMEDDIPDTHFIQGFMVGNGGSGEDAITTKNTDYSFIKLRNPIPFQQIEDPSLSPALAGQYLGVYRENGSNTKSYFIKKFDERPHIYHNWWRDGQRWDYMDPVEKSDLGPGAQNTPKTNRIETYAEIGMSIDVNNNDCLGYFSNPGNNQTPVINELGLVAYDTIPGERSIAEKVYDRYIKRILNLIFDNNRDASADAEVIEIAGIIFTALSETIYSAGQANMNAFIDLMEGLSHETAGSIDYSVYKNDLSSDSNIHVTAYYNQTGEYQYEEDEYKNILSGDAFAAISTDEAQRIKLITYYTFNAIPLQQNWKILINYRIYAN